MAENRYIRLQELIFNSYVLDSPVEIEKGALLLDTETNNVLLQLRLNILHDKIHEISSVKLMIDCFDDAGEIVSDLKIIDDTYRDLNILNQKNFGEKTPLVLDPRVRKVKVRINKVVFTNSKVWFYPNEPIFPSGMLPINSLNIDLYNQLTRDIGREKLITEYKYLPHKFDEYWCCACGRPNKNSIDLCRRCGTSKKWIFERINKDNILKNLESYLENVRQAEELENAAKIKRKKLLKLFSISIVSLTIILVLFFSLLLPFIKFNQASSYLSSEEYDKAISIFEELGDYSSSKGMILESNYQKAFSLLENDKFDEAISAFTNLGDYKDSEEMNFDSSYQKANYLLANKKYDEAISIFNDIESYKDSKELILESKYQKANYLLENGKFEEASLLFGNLENYKDSFSLSLKIPTPIKAHSFFENGEFELARENFIQLSNYEDVNYYLNIVEMMISIQGDWESSENSLYKLRFNGWNYSIIIQPNSLNQEVYNFKIKEDDINSECVRFRPRKSLHGQIFNHNVEGKFCFSSNSFLLTDFDALKTFDYIKVDQN
jgi:hypothetical protein